MFMVDPDLRSVMTRPHTMVLLAATALAAPGAVVTQLSSIVNADLVAAAGTILLVSAGVLAAIAMLVLAGDWMGVFSRWWPLPPLWGYRPALATRCHRYYSAAAIGYGGVIAYLVGVAGAGESLPVVVLLGAAVTLLAGQGACANLLLVAHDRQRYQRSSALWQQHLVGAAVQGR